MEELRRIAKQIRIESIRMVHRAKASHLGGALSITDVLAVLYWNIMKVNPANPEDENRDYLIYSKGHTCVALYAALALRGFYPISELETYAQEGSEFICHVSSLIPGIELSTGSLGHGFPVACGIAMALKRKNKSNRVYCIVGDGEMDEGSNWESLLFAAHHKLDNLTLIIDDNKQQAMGHNFDILDLEDLTDKLRAFRWNVCRIDGNDIEQINEALTSSRNSKDSKPAAIICDTIKGKGVSFMEDNLRFHYSPPSDDELRIAIKEIEQS